MALHDGIAWHAGSFGARIVSNSTNLFSSEHSSPSQLPEDSWNEPDRRRRSVSNIFRCLIADERAQRRA